MKDVNILWGWLNESTSSSVVTTTPKKKEKPEFAEWFREFNWHQFKISPWEEGHFCYYSETEVSSREEVAEILLLTDGFWWGDVPLLKYWMLIPLDKPSSTLYTSFQKHPIPIFEKEDHFELTLTPNLIENNPARMIDRILNLSKLEKNWDHLMEEFDLSVQENKEKILAILDASSEHTSFFAWDTFIFPKRKEPTQ